MKMEGERPACLGPGGRQKIGLGNRPPVRDVEAIWHRGRHLWNYRQLVARQVGEKDPAQ